VSGIPEIRHDVPLLQVTVDGAGKNFTKVVESVNWNVGNPLFDATIDNEHVLIQVSYP
jgi:hypothetical protein